MDFGHQHREGEALRAARAHHHGEILFAIDAERDGARAGHIVEADFPEYLSGGIVVRCEIAIESTGENDSSSRVERAGGLRGALAIDPNRFFRFEIECFHAADFSIGIVWSHADEPVYSRRKIA